MNIPQKIHKSNEIPYDKIQHFKNITNIYSNALKRFNRETSLVNTNLFYSKIKSWFFDLTLIQRYKVTSIENPWTSIILSQLYLLQKSKDNLRFIPRFNEKTIPLFEKIKPAMPNTLSHFLNYYAAVSENYETNPKLHLCNDFLDNIYFYRASNTDLLHNYSNISNKNYYHYFTLNTNIINNTDNFDFYFKTLSNDKCFIKPVSIINNNTIDIPEWAQQQKDSKLCFSVSEIFLSYFEQSICVNYIIAMYSKECKQIDRMLIEDVLKKYDDLIEFLKKRNDNDLYKVLDVEQKVKDVFYCVYIEKFIEGKKNSLPRGKEEDEKWGGKIWPVNSILKEVIKEIEKYFENMFKKEGKYDIEKIVKEVMFLNIEQLFTYDDFLFREIYIVIDDLYSRSQFDEFQNENDLVAFLSSNSNCSNNKKKKKKKKGKNKLTQQYTLITDNNETLPIKQDIPNDNNNENEYNLSCSTNTESLSIISPIISEIINLTLSQLNNSYTQNVIITNNISQPKKNKKKEKGFFLYSTQKKKKDPPPPQPKKSFLSKLNHDIISYEQSITNILHHLKPIKTYIINKLHSYISTSLNNSTNFNIEPYGSFQSDLDIESSDIDLQYKSLKKKQNILNTILSISQYLQSLKKFEAVNTITTATIPVIKLNIKPEVFIDSNEDTLQKYISFKQSSLYKNYPYDHNELDVIKVDISFPVLNNSNNGIIANNAPYLQVEYIKNSIMASKEIKAVIKIMKRILKETNLNNSYKGGLSSYTLFLITNAFYIYFISNRKNNNVNCYSHFLIEMIKYYSTFDFDMNIIDLNNTSNPYIQEKNTLNVPIIIDPITNQNAGKSSFQINEVIYIFQQCDSILSELKTQYDTTEDKIKSISCNDNFIAELINKLSKNNGN